MEDFFGSPDDEEEKAEGFIGEVGGGGFFLVRLMTRWRRPRALRRSRFEENIFLIFVIISLIRPTLH